MRYEILSVVDVGDSYAILIKDNEIKGEFVINSASLKNIDPELRLFVKARMFFIKAGAFDIKEEC